MGIKVKFYKLLVVSPLSDLKCGSKKFKTRNEAINYAFKQLPFGTQVEEEIVRNENNSIEYVCSNRSRITVIKQFA